MTAEQGAGSRIAVVGCGHVGVVTAAAFAELGHQVVGIDVDARRVNALQSGAVAFLEPGLSDLVARALSSSRLRFTSVYAEGIPEAAFIFLCVDTPATPIGAADLGRVRSAVAAIREVLDGIGERPVLVVKSTSPIGTGETIQAVLAGAFGRTGELPIAANPEFLREGSAVQDVFSPERIVVGSDEPGVAGRVAALFRGIDAPVILTDLRTAELIKYVSNAFLATRISFINEIARLCEHLQADLDTVVRGVGLDPRIGSAFFTAGIGYGGSCLPKDVAALCHTGDTLGVPMRVLEAVQSVNLNQKKHAVNSIRRLLGGSLEGRTVGVWGVAFKGGTDDLRDSPALDVIALLRGEGAFVQAFDPSLVPGEQQVAQVDRLCTSAIEAAAGAECVAVLADWPSFRSMDFFAVRQAMAGRFVYDGRVLLDRAAVERAGLVYSGIGRPPTWDSPPAAQ